MKYDFDQVVDRRNTNSYKWNVKENELPMWVADMDFPAAPEIRKNKGRIRILTPYLQNQELRVNLLDTNHKILVFIVVVYGIPFILVRNIIVCTMIIIK